MKILKNAGTFEIKSILMGDGKEAIKLIEIMGRIAYQSQDKITDDSAQKFVKMLREREHESVLEHSYMSVIFDNVSRGFTHELVRHRLMAITQESTRYVDESDFKVIVPPHRNEDEEISLKGIPGLEEVALTFKLSTLRDDDEVVHNSFLQEPTVSLKNFLLFNEVMYRALRKAGWAPEDARQILPQAIKSQIGVSANLREWRHIFKMRTDKTAHWEIRSVMVKLLIEVQKHIPVLFDDFYVAGEDKNGISYCRKHATGKLKNFVMKLADNGFNHGEITTIINMLQDAGLD